MFWGLGFGFGSGLFLVFIRVLGEMLCFDLQMYYGAVMVIGIHYEKETTNNVRTNHYQRSRQATHAIRERLKRFGDVTGRAPHRFRSRL